MKKVYVENRHPDYELMFAQACWEVVTSPEQADLIQFIGGADINPNLYGKLPHPTTSYSNNIDERSLILFEFAQKNNIPMAGICRGSQFMHVMAGGELVQDCDNHCGDHVAQVAWMPNTSVLVSSTHHQMMYSREVGDVLMWANNQATRKETMQPVKMDADKYAVVTMDYAAVTMDNDGQDIEAMYYPHLNAISFQPHPEFAIYEETKGKYDDCMSAYFFIINNYLKF